MATLDFLKKALRAKTATMTPIEVQPLSEARYSAGFDILTRGPGLRTYEDFVVPQLTQLLSPLFDSHHDISILEVGPGPRSVLGYLPDDLRRKIRQYTAFEPNSLFARKLENGLASRRRVHCRVWNARPRYIKSHLVWIAAHRPTQVLAQMMTSRNSTLSCSATTCTR